MAAKQAEDTRTVKPIKRSEGPATPVARDDEADEIERNMVFD